ncbi:MAG: enoyl-CoA hydratase [Motiliproteus sp.]|nr:enoyl-CoA hydratase [Motiliproteus sp.]MCW9051782.1 enoyl-CoA hydratase [Motiliproteus sp.]
MTSDPLVLRSVNNRICYLTLNRPQAYNALSIALMNAVISELTEIADDNNISTVVIRGAGRGFCAGHDLKEMTSSDDQALHDETFQTCSRLMMAITSLPKPVIAQVHGIATAAGCQLVASCDLAVAAESTRFATPGVNIGLFCSTPMVALTRTVAPKHAMEMLLLGDMISAQRAYEIGLINRVVDEQELESCVDGLATQIASKSSAVLKLGKQAFHQQMGQSLESAYQHCSTVMSCNMQTEDAQEGIDAFINKRQPKWKGR